MNELDMWEVFMRAASRSPRTIEERLSVTRRMLAASGATLGTVTAAQVADWLAELPVAASTRATYHGHLRAAFAWAQTVGIVKASPLDAVPPSRRPKSVPRPIATEAVAGLLAACNRRRTRMMVLLALFAGLRVHEIAKMHGRDVDVVGRTLYVDGKGGQRAIIPLHERIAEHAGGFPAASWWFPSPAGGHVAGRSVSTIIGRAMRRAGIAGTAHQLRHWYGTALLDAGVDIRVVQELMRHESIQSTTIYTRVSDAQRRAGIERLAA